MLQTRAMCMNAFEKVLDDGILYLDVALKVFIHITGSCCTPGLRVRTLLRRNVARRCDGCVSGLWFNCAGDGGAPQQAGLHKGDAIRVLRESMDTKSSRKGFVKFSSQNDSFGWT